MLVDCIAAPQKYCSRKSAVFGRSTLVRRIGRRPNSGVRLNPSLGRGPYVPFSVIKKVLWQKTSKQNPEGSRRENRKTEKQIVAASYATRISAANQVTQLESEPRSKPQIKVDAKLPATNYYGRKNLSGYQPQLFRAQREIVVLMPRRCAGWDARLTDATKLCDSAR